MCRPKPDDKAVLPFTMQQKRLIFDGKNFILQGHGPEYLPKIHLQRDAIHIGCYTVERAAIEKILDLLKKNYPN